MSTMLEARVQSVCGDSESLFELYTQIAALAEHHCGHPLDATETVQVLDYVRLESLKDKAYADIAKRGLGRMESNGRQSYWKDNKSAVLILRYMDQQKKILKGLGIGGSDPMMDDDETGYEDDFDSI